MLLSLPTRTVLILLGVYTRFSYCLLKMQIEFNLYCFSFSNCLLQIACKLTGNWRTSLVTKLVSKLVSSLVKDLILNIHPSFLYNQVYRTFEKRYLRNNMQLISTLVWQTMLKSFNLSFFFFFIDIVFHKILVNTCVCTYSGVHLAWSHENGLSFSFLLLSENRTCPSPLSFLYLQVKKKKGKKNHPGS